MSKNILQMKNISKFFPGVRALSNVDFTVTAGEIHGLIGENGAGKSTLMKVLMGLYKADEGKIFFKDKSVNITSPSLATSIGIGMVPQELNLNPYVSAAENIFLGNEIKNKLGKIDWKKIKSESVKILKTIGSDVDPNAIVENLSVAQQQLIQIARLLATGADLLIFDEPTASLTITETEFLLKLMKKLKEQGKTLIFITHRLQELLSTTDRITVMRDGHVVNVCETKDITIDSLIEDMAGKKIAKLERVNRECGDETVLKVENFSRGREFSNVSFEVKKGEIFGLGGLIGAGRTELMNAVFGLTKVTEGKVYFNDKEVKIKNPKQAIKLGIGYVPEERRHHAIFPILSVRENSVISVYDRLFKALKINYKEAEKITNEYIEKLKIKTPSSSTPIQSLSGGNQQKVILARWLARNAQLLILDEPTRGIDVNAKTEIYQLIRSLSEMGVTIIVVSSEHEELLLLTDRIMIMHEGKVKGIHNTKDLEQQDILEIALK